MMRSTVFGKLSVARCLAISFVIVLGTPVGALANDVLPGFDLFQTDPTNTQFNFAPAPIPADFFDPGSDPFTGIIAMQGLPLPGSALCPPPPTLCPNDDLSLIDTIVERIDLASLPSIGSSSVIDIEIVELSLKSISPITVTFNGGQDPEIWDVDVCLSPTPSPVGSMTITKTHADGGTFDSTLPVTPLFRFTRQSDAEQRVLDGGTEGITDFLNAAGVPWSYANPEPLSCRSNFCTPDPFSELGLLAAHGLLPSCASAPVPATSSKGLLVLAAALVSVGIVVMGRPVRGSRRVA
jgi:hypothetical protein